MRDMFKYFKDFYEEGGLNFFCLIFLRIVNKKVVRVKIMKKIVVRKVYL